MTESVTVSELTFYLKSLLDSDDALRSVVVRGELSNVKKASNGALYFTMKDEKATLSCVMFQRDASRLRFLPTEGMQAVAFGSVSIYPKGGSYQLYTGALEPLGVGALYKAYEQLKEQLLKEGLFDAAHKLPLPRYPQKIALVTSPSGAAVRDMIRVLKKRFPLARILVCPVPVQGEGAAAEIAKALRFLSEKKPVELIILGRGGGSIEDLWAFNEEILARAIYDCRIPLISAVGHEPGVTISDFVADLRAATPSNGAELAVPDQNEIRIRLKKLDSELSACVSSRISREKTRLGALSSRRSLATPLYRVNEKRMTLDHLDKDVNAAVARILSDRRSRFRRLAAALDAYSPLGVLKRGYSIVTKEGLPLYRASDAKRGDRLRIRLSEGSLDCRVESILSDGNHESEGNK